jgi:hypothetical protein
MEPLRQTGNQSISSAVGSASIKPRKARKAYLPAMLLLDETWIDMIETSPQSQATLTNTDWQLISCFLNHGDVCGTVVVA